MSLFTATPTTTSRKAAGARSARRVRGIVALVVLFAVFASFAASRGGAASDAGAAGFFPAPAAGPEDGALGAPAAAAASDGFGDPFEGLFGRTMVGLALFAIALAIVLVVVRRRFGSRPFQSGRRLALLETLPLGGRRFVCLLSLDRERLLVVGVSGENFSLLSETQSASLQTTSRDGAAGAPPTGSAAPPGRSFEAALEKAGANP